LAGTEPVKERKSVKVMLRCDTVVRPCTVAPLLRGLGMFTIFIILAPEVDVDIRQIKSRYGFDIPFLNIGSIING
jgi:hypothetical protein